MDEEDRLAKLLAQAIGRELGLAARQGAVVHHQAGRFVDHGHVLVEVEHGELR